MYLQDFPAEIVDTLSDGSARSLKYNVHASSPLQTARPVYTARFFVIGLCERILESR